MELPFSSGTLYCLKMYLDGKEAMKFGGGGFNKAASRVYSTLAEEERKRLALVTESVHRMKVCNIQSS